MGAPPSSPAATDEQVLAAPAGPAPAPWRKDLEWLALALVVIGLALAMDVTAAREGVTVGGWRLPELCSFKRWTGHDCPGCGLTRSFVLGIRGDPAAFRLNAMGPLLLLLLVAQVPYRGGRLVRAWHLARQGLVDLGGHGAEPRSWRWGRRVVLALLALSWVANLGLRVLP